MTFKIGLHIPSFTYPGTVEDIFPQVAAQAKAAEASGFDALTVMDHFYQLPALGKPEEPMLEAYTLLGALASTTSRLKLATLVTGNTYRNPALLAKVVTTLDVVSGGRAFLGIGAGWYELEHAALGFEFGTFTDRFERLAEAFEIIAPMLRGERPSFDGKWYRAKEALNEPRLRDDLPIMLGGSGEQKTFRLAAKYADHLNIVGTSPGELPRKLDVLAERCAEIGRDPATLATSTMICVGVSEDGERARQSQREHFAKLGVDLDALSPEERAAQTAGHFVGTPQEVAEGIKSQILSAGVGGVTVVLFGGHEPGIVELAGATLAPLFS
ncbi:LLM class F420-dependent oxidoreductase [Segniliparus rugosus]|uniref:Luciferase-like domain-containing protein n=1 Tax=Segniliparus rugosus (strain ATCC BAA-974 / DSM 45345 / CCUG 50838 / CIP 108380 / JCM 13579 / CDC 945) TaxID=679197 RepID=E5XRL5_SEGRC|nr:LLM class F420-dependent oxidoreductase [Segniliparus rugosus]EFV12978.2 hypothetical protein HMPREF9336_02137 [Segniliparus rugosus ATCC BAA-974]